ncbi:hypothetical protein [Vibrio europaeus]|uniref:hypothetical protein n=1 Tax=Vibrio europaeus TaxID=300876 RepID=UPI00233E5CFE|nr:hypothetical protein [Vibrio europaeus]MDC5857349.1 hypothetical protein [Vibrio europaeus]
METTEIVGSILVILNILVSAFLCMLSTLSAFQKIAQIAIVWLVPFIGAIGLWIFHRTQDDNNDDSGSFGGGGNDSLGVSSQGD